MFILARYIIKEHLGPFFFSLAVIMFVFVTKFIVQYIGKIFGKGLSLWTIFELIYLNLAWMMALAVPMAVLISALMAFGRLSADNEITILKTSGISIYKIIRPVLIWAIILTMIMIWFNDRVLPEYNHRARLLFMSISRKKPTLQLEQGIYMNMGKFSILVDDIRQSLGEEVHAVSDMTSPNPAADGSDELRGITIFDRSNSNLQRTVIADHGKLIFDKNEERLIFTLFDGEIHEINYKDYSEYRRLKFTKNIFHIPAPELVFKRANDNWRGDREMTTTMMRKEIAKYDSSRNREQTALLQVISDYFPNPDSLDRRILASGRANNLPKISDTQRQRDRSRALRKTQGALQRLRSIKKNRNHYERQIYKYQVEIHKKYAIPFACIVFVLIGAPLGIKARKGSLGVGITFSIGFFLLYWVFLIGGEELADRQLISPFLAMWMGNITVGIFGLYLTYRVVKETAFIQWDRLPKFLQLFFRGDEDSA